MLEEYKKPLIPISVLLVLASASYFLFQTYQPKALKLIEEVKGYKTERDLNLPVPTSAKELGRSVSDQNKQITYMINEPAEATQKYYKNILVSKGWEIESQINSDTSTKTRYRSGDKRLTVTTSSQDTQTILSLEIF